MLSYLFLNHKRQNTYSISETVTSDNEISYEVGERIDSGGNAVVHRCYDSGNGNEYAIKFNLSFQANRVRRFRQEIAILQSLEHGQIIKCIDTGTVAGTHAKRTTIKQEIMFMVMPVAETNLLEYIKQRGNGLAYSEYIGQIKGICSALSELHAKAIHRDIKPENILVIGDTWYLSDLGLCKYTVGCESDISTENEIIGPRYWMSPEALNRIVGNTDEITIKSDIYQLASIIWFVINRRHPSGIVDRSDWHGPDFLFEPIIRSLSHKQDNRVETAAELLELIEETA